MYVFFGKYLLNSRRYQYITFNTICRQKISKGMEDFNNNGERVNDFPLKIKHKPRMCALTTSTKHCIGGPSPCNEIRNKRHINWKGKSKTDFSHRENNNLCRRLQAICKKKKSDQNQ